MAHLGIARGFIHSQVVLVLALEQGASPTQVGATAHCGGGLDLTK